jgi:hypothetical protein
MASELLPDGLWELVEPLKKQPFEMNDFIRTFLMKWVGKAKLWGESAVPFLAETALALEADGNQPYSQGLIFNMMETIAKQNTDTNRGMPNSYYGPEEAIRLREGLEPHNYEIFRGVSYTLESLVHFLAKRLLRVALKLVWYKITAVQYTTFIPDQQWKFFCWAVNDGVLSQRPPGRPQSWDELLRIAESTAYPNLPKRLIQRPEFVAFFSLVYQHRWQPDLFRLLDNAVNQT